MSKDSLSRRSFLRFTALGFSAWGLLACDRRMDLNKKLAKSSNIPTPTIPIATPAGALPGTQPPTPTMGSSPMTEVSPTSEAAPTQTGSIPDQSRSGSIYSSAQLERLQDTAHRFLAETPSEAVRVARSLGYMNGNEHPSTMGGPLSVAILRQAGFISAYTDLHDFWMLNPRPAEDTTILESIFPKRHYLWYFNQQSIRDFDFVQFPLQAGDFLYLFAGEAGTFEQMCTVSRVDEAGRAYSIININTPDGFIIKEVMLYDPNQPGSGQFAAWTDRKYILNIGTTGFGGFQLWRRQVPLFDPGPLEQALAKDIDDLLSRTGGTWRVLFKELDGAVVYARQEHHKLHPASVIKVAIAMLWFKSFEKWGQFSSSEILAKGLEGRTYAQLLKAMLVDSEEDATQSIIHSIEMNKLDIPATLREWGAPVTEIYNRLSTAWETTTLLEGLYAGRCVSPAARQVILDLMSMYTSGDDLRLGSIHKFLPPSYPIYNKRGSLTKELMILADAGILTIPISHGDRIYVAALFAYQGESAVSFDELELAMQKLALIFWEYTRKL